MTTITFKGYSAIECNNVISYTATSYSSDDVLTTAVRPCLDIRFPSTTDQKLLTTIFSSKDGALSEISLKRTNKNPNFISTSETPNQPEYLNEEFIHSDYDIPVKLSLEYVDGILMWVMTIAQLTQIDQALREIAGKVAKKTDFLTFEEYQLTLVEKSKTDLDTFLIYHPLISSCHQGIYQKYNATLTHQFLFTSNYMVHYMKTQAGMPSTFRWNTSGDTCNPWTDVEALLFVTDMAAYVTPLIEAQQNYEKMVLRATTKEELDRIIIDYSAVVTPNKSIKLLGHTDANWVGYSMGGTTDIPIVAEPVEEELLGE